MQALRSKAVVLFGYLDRRDSQGEPIQREFDMDRFARLRRAKSLNKAGSE